MRPDWPAAAESAGSIIVVILFALGIYEGVRALAVRGWRWWWRR